MALQFVEKGVRAALAGVILLCLLPHISAAQDRHQIDSLNQRVRSLELEIQKLQLQLDELRRHLSLLTAQPIPHPIPDELRGSENIQFGFPGGEGMVVKVSSASAQLLQEICDSAGAMVTGRRQFDLTNGWNGSHPVNVPIFVVTHRSAPEEWIKEHPNAPFTFVYDGVESAVRQAQRVAGFKNVIVDGASIVQQALRAGLVDEVAVFVAPKILGGDGLSLARGRGPARMAQALRLVQVRVERLGDDVLVTGRVPRRGRTPPARSSPASSAVSAWKTSKSQRCGRFALWIS